MPQRRRIKRNHALRNELIGKGLIVPRWGLAAWLRSKGFLVAAEAADNRR